MQKKKKNTPSPLFYITMKKGKKTKSCSLDTAEDLREFYGCYLAWVWRVLDHRSPQPLPGPSAAVSHPRSVWRPGHPHVPPTEGPGL